MRVLGAALAALLVGLVAMAGLGGIGVASLLGGSDAIPSASAVSAIAPATLTLYQAAASVCPGLPWTVLAAIGTVESDNGTSTLPGVHSGANAAGAEGPMQFEPGTFSEYALPVPPGGVSPPSPYDLSDAVYAAARLLCANGGAGDADLSKAVFAYNHSAAYVTQVLTLAAQYSATLVPTATAGNSVAATAVAWAVAQIGTPYVWGGETPGRGFDCSGLVQAAYSVAGVALPRVAQNQYDAGPSVSPGSALEPGDLVFFGTSAHDVTHVGLVVAPPFMVDAPHTGANVRIEQFPTTVGASWGSDRVIGFTRPA